MPGFEGETSTPSIPGNMCIGVIGPRDRARARNDGLATKHSFSLKYVVMSIMNYNKVTLKLFTDISRARVLIELFVY